MAQALKAQTLEPYHDQAGIDHVYTQRVFNGGGVAFFDSDNDGDDDLYITGGEDVDHFYINNGDGTFLYHSPFAGINITLNFYTTGVNIGDFNNDGWNDIFVTTIFDRDFEFVRNLLFVNQGDNTFREVWDQDAIPDEVWSMGASLIDFDLDGDLDIYTINYIKESILVKNEQDEVVGFAHECSPNRFYENLGDFEFTEISAQLGLNDDGCALAVVATDYDNDGDSDIYLANDFGEFIVPNKLFRNEIRAEGRFIEESIEKGTDLAIYGMGIALGDIDNDLDQDLYVTNLGTNVLLENQLDSFINITQEAGVGNTWNTQDSTFAVSWGANFLDIDNDLDQDLFVVNGFAPSSLILPTEFEDADQLYINDGNGNFELDNTEHPSSNEFTTRGTAYSDYDNDGDLDIFSVVFDRPSNGGKPRSILYRNTGNTNNWLKLNLKGVIANSNAIGSKATLFTEGHTLMREVTAGSSHLSQNTASLHFGLGSIPIVDSIRIDWPGGINSQSLYEIEVNQTLNVLEDTSRLVTVSNDHVELKELAIAPNPVRNYLYLDLDNSITNDLQSIEVIDQMGRVHLRESDETMIHSKRLNLQNLPPGWYILRLNGTGVSYVAKLIIGH